MTEPRQYSSVGNLQTNTLRTKRMSVDMPQPDPRSGLSSKMSGVGKYGTVARSPNRRPSLQTMRLQEYASVEKYGTLRAPRGNLQKQPALLEEREEKTRKRNNDDMKRFE